jgi:hypothetical protein
MISPQYQIVLSHRSKWFTSGKLVLNLDKINIIKFITNKSQQHNLNFVYDEKYIEEPINTKFLGLQNDNNLNWENNIDLIIPKLSRACYAIRSMSHISSTDTLIYIYFASFHSMMKRGIIFYGNSTNSKIIFTSQKRTVRIIAGVESRNSCRNLFMSLLLFH